MTDFYSIDEGFGSPSQPATFSASQTSPTASAYGSPGDKNMQPKRPQQTILPVVLRQVRDAVEEEKQKFVIDGKPVTQLTMVVQIVTADKSATHMQMLVDDGTAQVAMRQYHQAEDDSEAATQLRAGMYVRVVGNIRKMKDGMNVIGFSVEPVTDFNEVTFHIARAMQVHALNTKGAPPAASAAAAAGGTATPAASASAIVAEASSSPIQTQVLDVFKNEPDTESGVSISTVVARLASFDANEVRRAVAALAEEGQLYSTIDEDHFKSSEC